MVSSYNILFDNDTNVEHFTNNQKKRIVFPLNKKELGNTKALLPVLPSLKDQEAFLYKIGNDIFDLFIPSNSNFFENFDNFIGEFQLSCIIQTIFQQSPLSIDLPWELAYNPATGFIARNYNFVRFIDRKINLIEKPTDKLDVLVLRYHKNKQAIITDKTDKIWEKNAGKISVIETKNKPINALFDTLNEKKKILLHPHVVHIITHGIQGGKLELMRRIETQNGDEKIYINEWIECDAKQLNSYFRGIFTTLPKLVILHACNSSLPHQVMYDPQRIDYATSLIQMRIPVVMSFQNPILQTDADEFIAQFYSEILRGSNITEATRNARGTLFTRNFHLRDTPGDLAAFGYPVLVTSTPTLVLYKSVLSDGRSSTTDTHKIKSTTILSPQKDTVVSKEISKNILMSNFKSILRKSPTVSLEPRNQIISGMLQNTGTTYFQVLSVFNYLFRNEFRALSDEETPIDLAKKMIKIITKIKARTVHKGNGHVSTDKTTIHLRNFHNNCRNFFNDTLMEPLAFWMIQCVGFQDDENLENFCRELPSSIKQVLKKELEESELQSEFDDMIACLKVRIDWYVEPSNHPTSNVEIAENADLLRSIWEDDVE